jgi:hypothetical protein
MRSARTTVSPGELPWADGVLRDERSELRELTGWCVAAWLCRGNRGGFEPLAVDPR